jgi:cyclic pyranopterin phosphate synthase
MKDKDKNSKKMNYVGTNIVKRDKGEIKKLAKGEVKKYASGEIDKLASGEVDKLASGQIDKTDSNTKLTHFDDEGNAIMVDVSGKQDTARTAVAKGKIKVNQEVMDAIINKEVKKGDVLQVAQIAGIMAVKKTWELIPLCHPLMLQKCSIDFDIDKDKNEVEAICTVKVEGKTGVEMEALMGVHIALLTIYDMCKAIDKSMVMTDIHLVKKTGGKSGTYVNERDK